jgi:hypothetical protein
MTRTRGERKKFALTARTRVTRPNPRLSNTVLVKRLDVSHICYVGFSEDLVYFVGQKLPRGVAPTDPAYLVVTQDAHGWEVQAHYYRDDTYAKLWRAEKAPEWLTFPKNTE